MKVCMVFVMYFLSLKLHLRLKPSSNESEMYKVLEVFIGFGKKNNRELRKGLSVRKGLFKNMTDFYIEKYFR